MYAAQACDLPLVLLLIEERCTVSETDDRQRSALHWCVSSEGPDSTQAREACGALIALLIESGLKVRLRSKAHSVPFSGMLRCR